jgi:hypothetical protein
MFVSRVHIIALQLLVSEYALYGSSDLLLHVRAVHNIDIDTNHLSHFIFPSAQTLTLLIAVLLLPNTT